MPHWIAAAFAVALASFGIVGCGQDKNGPTGSVVTPAERVEQGWGYFEQGDYARALQEFESATGGEAGLADGWNGAGWALGKLPGRLALAPAKFARAMQLDASRYDALGGWAFAAYQLGEWRSALQKSDSLLRRRPGWRFLHQPTLDEKDIRLLEAAAHYNLGEFSLSYQVILDHLNASFEADVSTTAGRRELLDEIEKLRRVYG